MEEIEASSQSNLLKEENAASSEGGKVTSPDQGISKQESPKSASPKANTKPKVENKSSSKLSKFRIPGNAPLVLQMYSHIKIQKQLEQEKNSKIARTDRKRQKIKRDLAASCPPVYSSSNTFGASWTQCRVPKHLPSSTLQEPQDGQNVSDASDSSKELSDQNNERSDTDGESALQTSANGRVEHFGGRSYKIMDSARSSQAERTTRHHLTRHSPSLQSTFKSQPPDGQQSHIVKSHNINNSKNIDREKPSTPSTVHILKGPGKFQIRFSTSSTPASRQRDRGRKLKYQWDSMPPGSIASGQPSLITLDGSLL
ncbi:double-headed protease inhibitor, submandibular gland [Plakobranchus ocellatus]|uniref:Double-headed protease inhibitor, submandibular gland n=1 Tax=Plakobranchus ocellatus TaxID=259542 RepID=A0AAV3YIP1_9GAST|nr:double-headed protease inhibitor, submandibular gland [Plakobranchus ocellatus]